MAENLFKQYPNLEEYFETSDGQKFFKETAAKTHARTLEDKKVTAVNRADFEQKPKSANEILALVSEMDLETAQSYLEAENELKKPRQSVVGALEERIKELENPAQDEA